MILGPQWVTGTVQSLKDLARLCGLSKSLVQTSRFERGLDCVKTANLEDLEVRCILKD
jgi:hypothetical protein